MRSFRRAAPASPPASARMSISISKFRAQMLVSTPGGSPPASAKRSATCDSPMPYVRISQRRRGCARANSGPSEAWSGAIVHSRRSSDGTPGSTTTYDPPTAITSPGAVPAIPSTSGSGRDLRLLAVARVEPGAVEAVALRHLVRPAVDPPEHVLVEHELDARDLRKRLDGAVVVRRPEAAGRDDQVGRFEHQAQPGPDVGRLVADDERAPQREPQPLERRGQVRPILIGDDPSHELVAGQQDGGGGPAQAARAPAASRRIRCPAGTCGRTTWRPSMRSETLPGAPRAR